MEAMEERRVWQRVRGEQPDLTQRLREMLVRQGQLRSAYRSARCRLPRAGLLLEQKEGQIAALRGMLKLLTGQGAAMPKCTEGGADLKLCFEGERQFLSELEVLKGDDHFGCVFEAMLRRQQRQCRMLLELIGTI